MIPHGVEVYVGLDPIDLRWGFNRLTGLVTERIGRDARSGALFVFFGKRREAMKVLFSTSSATCRATAAPPTSSTTSSAVATSAPRPSSPPTSPTSSGGPCSPAPPASSRSSTASPSTATASRSSASPGAATTASIPTTRRRRLDRGGHGASARDRVDRPVATDTAVRLHGQVGPAGARTTTQPFSQPAGRASPGAVRASPGRRHPARRRRPRNRRVGRTQEGDRLATTRRAHAPGHSGRAAGR